MSLPQKQIWERWSPRAIREYLSTYQNVNDLRALCLVLADQIESEDEAWEGMQEGTALRIKDLEDQLTCSKKVRIT